MKEKSNTLVLLARDPNPNEEKAHHETTFRLSIESADQGAPIRLVGVCSQILGAQRERRGIDASKIPLLHFLGGN